MDEKINKRACFTGHRPEKLTRTEGEIKAELEVAIIEAITEGYRTFITGMARGVDIWAGEMVLKVKKEFPAYDIKLICAVPYEGFDEKWDKEWSMRYQNLLKQADLVKTLSACYNPGVFQERNEWMVERSSKVIAVYSGENSGTKNTLDYAQKKKKKIKVISGCDLKGEYAELSKV